MIAAIGELAIHGDTWMVVVSVEAAAGTGPITMAATASKVEGVTALDAGVGLTWIVPPAVAELELEPTSANGRGVSVRPKVSVRPNPAAAIGQNASVLPTAWWVDGEAIATAVGATVHC